jgi:redox-sensitive bicupin YhaK (pirin superfamily)
VHVARGSVSANGTRLDAGDAASWTAETTVHLEKGANAEVLLFDLDGVEAK